MSRTTGSPSEARDEIDPLARDLAAANAEQIVWGSDWPHSPHHRGVAVEDPPEAPYRDLDRVTLMDTIRQWFDEPRRWQEILVDNQARLYAF